MRLYRSGSVGEAVRDIQDRLAALGFDPVDDPRGEFGPSTTEATRSFQQSRGLSPDGIIGPDTWRALYEAGYRLGDRLLYLRRPMLRGEDVAELQSRLNGLGFDAGKVDSIYGPDTQRAIYEFQANRNLTEDGVAGPEVTTELRLVTRGPIRAGREAIREREWLRASDKTIVGTKVFFDAAARSSDEARQAWAAANAAALEFQERGGLPLVSHGVDERLPERVRAGRANRGAADLIVSFQQSDEDRVFFFETPRSRSEVGERLARAVSREIGGTVEGRATAMLRETRSPAIVIARNDLDESLGRKTVAGIDRFFASL
jgi:N-acetylmuramoyl-L-alanine amidase